jgi:hypothetical protein
MAEEMSRQHSIQAVVLLAGLGRSTVRSRSKEKQRKKIVKLVV